MSDKKLRQLERKWRESQTVEDEAVYLLELVRVGERDRAYSRIACSDNEIARQASTPGLGCAPPRVKFDEKHESCWRIQFADPAGQCELSGPWPTQGIGEIEGIHFWFRAKDRLWEFETETDDQRPFPVGHPLDFRVKERREDAFEMDLELALGVLIRCLCAFQSHKPTSNGH